MDRVVGGHFRLRRRIGAGSFGEIYSAESTRTHRRVAVKLENFRSRAPQLSYESKLYQIFSGGTGIPKLHWYGTEDNYNVMVIDLLGKSLEDLFEACHRRFSVKTVLMLADQMISCVEFIHNKNFIHRDVKPDNFVMGLDEEANQVFIIDFGLAKKYRDPHTHMHIPYVEGKSLTGTARYASVSALRGFEQSRRDDLESLGFVWLYLLRGSLPWMGLTGRDQKQKYERICDVKSRTSFEELCHGFPSEFVRYFQKVRNLRFAESPNYAELKALFRNLFMKEGYIYDYKYDWVKETPILTPSSPRPIPAGSPPTPLVPPPGLRLRKPEVEQDLSTPRFSLDRDESGPLALQTESGTNRRDSILLSYSRTRRDAETGRRQTLQPQAPPSRIEPDHDSGTPAPPRGIRFSVQSNHYTSKQPRAEVSPKRTIGDDPKPQSTLGAVRPPAKQRPIESTTTTGSAQRSTRRDPRHGVSDAAQDMTPRRPKATPVRAPPATMMPSWMSRPPAGRPRPGVRSYKS